MTETSATDPIRLHKQLDRIWRTPPGWGRLSAVNHTIIGRRFIITAFVYFGIGGILAMLIRAQLATPRSAFVGPEIYNQIFTMHGTIMMFLFAIPLFEGLAMYLLPKMLGARDMAFPRLSAYGYWCYLFGGSILIVGLVLGLAPDGGWFMYTPLSSRTYTPGINADIWLIGITFVEISALSAAIEIIVTIFKLRAPGMSLDKMPLFAWYMLVTAFMMLFGFPPLIVGSVLLEIERAFDLPFFDPTRGGDPLLWQHLFWLFGHPEVYIIFLPAAGIVSTVLPVLARREIVGYIWIVVSIVALAFLSFGLWVHHMFTVGIPHLALAFFSAASTAVAFPTAVQFFAWIGTLASGRPQLKLPMLFLLGFFFVFAMGGLTGVMLAIVPFNWQVHDTHFVVAHLHYVLVGGFIFPMLAAAYYWLPHFTGRSPRLSFGVTAFWLIFIGFNLTFLIMHATGLMGMPRRIYTYDDGAGWEWLNLMSSIGSFLMAIGFALFTLDIVLQVTIGKRAKRNPWNANTLEWATAMPPPTYNFASLAAVTSRTPLADAPGLAIDLARGQGYLGFVREGRLETLGVDITSGRLELVVRLPNSTFMPLFSALATGMFFVAVLLKFYLVAVVGFVATIVLLLLWTPGWGDRSDRGLMPVGHGEASTAAYRGERRAVELGDDAGGVRQRHSLCLAGVRHAVPLGGGAELAAAGTAATRPAGLGIGRRRSRRGGLRGDAQRQPRGTGACTAARPMAGSRRRRTRRGPGRFRHADGGGSRSDPTRLSGGDRRTAWPMSRSTPRLASCSPATASCAAAPATSPPDAGSTYASAHSGTSTPQQLA